MRPLALRLLVCGLLALSGCGGERAASDQGDADLLLDFTPNAVHAGIYLAAQRGFDEAEGVHLRVRAPGSSTDALKLLQAGRTDLAVLDIHDLGLARERGRDVVGVMALVQQPLAAVLAQRSIRRPRQLEGRRAGVTGLPSDDAVLDAVVRGDGGDPSRVRKTTIGFEAVKALLADRVSAATAFWNVEGVALGDRVRQFRVSDYGAPSYPELVLCATRETLEDRRPLVVAAVKAIQRGYAQAQLEPDNAVDAIAEQVRGADRDVLTRELDAVAPAFTAGAAYPGQLRPDVLRAWAAWDVRFGILERRPEVAAAFDPSIAAGRR
jgi:putative hydroxymethylpyrimidine transport system substrate-binding protein